MSTPISRRFCVVTVIVARARRNVARAGLEGWVAIERAELREVARPAESPAGVLVDGATALVERKLPQPRAAERDQALEVAQELFLKRDRKSVV